LLFYSSTSTIEIMQQKLRYGRMHVNDGGEKVVDSWYYYNTSLEK